MIERDIPPTHELFTRRDLVQRHPTLFSIPRLQWAIRNRATNGLLDAVYETRGGELLIHEPSLIRWFLGLTGRKKCRSPRRRADASRRAEAGSYGRAM